MMGAFDVIIVGGGLAGPLPASGLLAAGVKVDLYEKLAVDAKRDGYQIRVAQPCLAAFRQNLSEAQCGRITSKMGHFESNTITTPIWYDHNLKKLLELGRLSSQYHGSAPMDRVVLRDIIMERPVAEGIVHFGKSFSEYEIVSNEGDEKVRVWFEDGSSADCDILIGADGSHSKPLGILPFYVSLTEKHISVLQEHSNSIGIDNNSKDNDSAATFTFSMLLPKDDCPAEILKWNHDDKWQFLQNSISSWDEIYRQIIDVIRSEDLYVFEPRATIRPPLGWRSKIQSSKHPSLAHPRVWLMGDAMHVMLPNRGMGGNQAMLDTTVLLPLLQRLDNRAQTSGQVSKDAITAACNEYEQEMIPRTFQWVEASGGLKPVPMDTNTILGRLIAWYMRFSLDLRDTWNAILQAFSLKDPGVQSSH